MVKRPIGNNYYLIALYIQIYMKLKVYELLKVKFLSNDFHLKRRYKPFCFHIPVACVVRFSVGIDRGS